MDKKEQIKIIENMIPKYYEMIERSMEEIRCANLGIKMALENIREYQAKLDALRS